MKCFRAHKLGFKPATSLLSLNNLSRLEPSEKGRQRDQVEVPPVSLADLVTCLLKLRKSVDRWTERGGRQR